LIALLCLLQDPALEPLLRDLGADTLEVRDRAVEKLVERGEEVRKAVAALVGSPDPEVAARAKMVLAGLEERAKLTAALGPPKSYDIKAADESLVEVLKRFRRESGLPFKIERVPLAARVTCDIRERHALVALEKLCAAQGGVRLEPWHLTVTRGAPVRYPLAAKDRWVVTLKSLNWRRDLSDGDGSGHTTVVVAWDSRDSPANITLELESVTDDQGNELADESRGGSPSSTEKLPVRSVSASHRIPAETARALTVRGKVVLEYALARKTLSFDTASPGQTQSAGKISLRLRDCADDRINLEGEWPSDEGLRLFRAKMEVIDSEGRRHQFHISSTSSSSNRSSAQGPMPPLPEGVQVRSVEIEIVTETLPVTIPFEFRDVPLTP
jgi:hypothetical protein